MRPAGSHNPPPFIFVLYLSMTGIERCVRRPGRIGCLHRCRRIPILPMAVAQRALGRLRNPAAASFRTADGLGQAERRLVSLDRRRRGRLIIGLNRAHAAFAIDCEPSDGDTKRGYGKRGSGLRLVGLALGPQHGADRHYSSSDRD